MTKEELALEIIDRLKQEYPDVDALAAADVGDIERIVRPCGLGHSKARDISACMKILQEQYEGKVPDDFNVLLKLPGVGRKSANLIMGDVFRKPAIVTDTHCIRLANRMGLVDGIKDPKKAVIFATGWCTTAEMCVQRGQSLIAISAVSAISVRKMGFRSIL